MFAIFRVLDVFLLEKFPAPECSLRITGPFILSEKLFHQFVSGHDFPADPGAYRVIVHCGSCMLNRRETLHRLNRAAASGVPVVNYGMLISFCQGVLERVMEPFDAARRD